MSQGSTSLLDSPRNWEVYLNPKPMTSKGGPSLIPKPMTSQGGVSLLDSPNSLVYILPHKTKSACVSTKTN